jgi:phospholipid/cholesterol/gamma-HCH transport system substrate-binding protein
MAILITALYFIGAKQNLFGNTRTIKAKFRDVSGLVPGNNVRYAGIDVGTVDEIRILNDTTILVEMLIQEDVIGFIKNNSVAAIGTDGLMGNKLVNITSAKSPGVPVKEGDFILSREGIEMDQMVRTLNITNENVMLISEDLRDVSLRLKNSNSVWGLLGDTLMVHEIRDLVHNLNKTSASAERFSHDLEMISANIRQGNGLAGAILTDSAYVYQLDSLIHALRASGDSLQQVATGIKQITDQLQNGSGVGAAVISDSTISRDLQISMANIKTGTEAFKQNMEALKHNFLLRRYFRNQEKQKQKNQTP